MDKIKECPYCGGEATIRVNYNPKTDMYYTFLRCLTCEATTRAISSEYDPAESDNLEAIQDAIKLWNRRTNK